MAWADSYACLLPSCAVQRWYCTSALSSSADGYDRVDQARRCGSRVGPSGRCPRDGASHSAGKCCDYEGERQKLYLRQGHPYRADDPGHPLSPKRCHVFSSESLPGRCNAVAIRHHSLLAGGFRHLRIDFVQSVRLLHRPQTRTSKDHFNRKCLVCSDGCSGHHRRRSNHRTGQRQPLGQGWHHGEVYVLPCGVYLRHGCLQQQETRL